MNNIKFHGKCYECEKSIVMDAADVNLFCDKCDVDREKLKEKLFRESCKEMMIELANNSYIWMDKDSFVEPTNENEKIAYLSGTRNGITHALWVLREYLDVEEQDRFWAELCDKMPEIE